MCLQSFIIFPLMNNSTLLVWPILYINSVSLSIRPSISRGPKSHITFNKIVPPEFEGPKTIEDLEFLLLTFTFTSVSAQQLLSSMGEVFLGFGRWVRRFGCPKTIQDLEFLFLTFTFTFVSAQWLPSSMGEVFLGFGGWARRFGCAFLG
jgi:hypothetical protein